MSEEDCLYQCRWAVPKPLKADRTKRRGRVFARLLKLNKKRQMDGEFVLLLELGHSSPAPRNWCS